MRRRRRAGRGEDKKRLRRMRRGLGGRDKEE